MTCPFQVGDRIHEVQILGTTRPKNETLWSFDLTKPDATVTALTERGFKYRYDHPIPFGRAAWGQTTDGGECFESGFQFWRRID